LQKINIRIINWRDWGAPPEKSAAELLTGSSAETNPIVKMYCLVFLDTV
jgi:hypothetical protein